MPATDLANTTRNDVICLDLGEQINEPVLCLLAECIRQIDPDIERASECYGAGMTMAALIVIAVNMAIEHGDSALIADALRDNAEMLDVEARLRTLTVTA